MLTDIIMETNQLTLFREIINFLSENHIKSTIRYSSQKVEPVNVKQKVHNIATWLKGPV
jgi:hypothetical protein